MSNDLSLFRHQYTTRVRFYHVDRQNIVYHLWYLYFLEEGRLEYLREIGFHLGDQSFISEYRFYIAHNSIDYYASARFDDELIVYSRIATVKNSSLRFEHAIAQKATGTLLTTGSHVLVHVNAGLNQPERIPDHLRDMIRRYEGDRVSFVEK
jgi:acyl-CoA thioester hydrolase